MGRHSKFKKKYCQMLRSHMGKGLSFESFAGEIKVNVDTLYEWAKTHEIFSEAKKDGAALSRLRWEKIGNAALLGQETVDEFTGKKINWKNFNTTVWVFSMKNRFGWRDRTTIEHEGNPDKPVEINNRSDEEILKRVTELGEKLKNIKSK